MNKCWKKTTYIQSFTLFCPNCGNKMGMVADSKGRLETVCRCCGTNIMVSKATRRGISFTLIAPKGLELF